MPTISNSLGLQIDGSFNVPADRLHDLQANVAKMTRRAKRIDQNGLTLQVVKSVRYTYRDARTDETLTLPCVNVRISGQVPTINGWSLIARIEHLDVGNLVSKAPSAYTRELPEHFRTCAPTCDHCKQNRARNDTFVLENSQGVTCRVGRNCLADFVRSADIASAVNMFGLISKVQSMILGECDEDHYFSGGRHSGYASTLVYLTKVVCAMRLHGWCSRKESNNTGMLATADRIADIAMSQTTDMDAQEAELVYDWAQDLCSREQVSDYISNLRTACAQGYVDSRSKGLVASAVQAYRNELAFNAAQEAKRGNPSKHVGMVGDKLTFNATVTRCIQKDGMYGMTTIIAMLDDVGNEYTWFASGCHEYKVSQVVKCKGTVKAHNDYQGTKQTILTRCKLSA
jgi:hypothetical protein